MLIDREGRFKASFMSRAVNRTGKNDLLTFVAGFRLVQELINGEWEPVDGDYEITEYFNLVCKDESLNEVTMSNLKKATGWTGGDPFWLDTADLSTMWVQLKIEFETYNEQTRPRVKYIDKADASGMGVEPADEKTRKEIMARYGARFRATAGGTPRSAPAPTPGTKPAATAAAATTTPAPAANAEPALTGLTKDEAWEKFSGIFPKGATDEHKASEWGRILELHHPGKPDDQITPDEWALFCVKAKSDFVPFSDNIPF